MFYDALASFHDAFEHIFFSIYGVPAISDEGVRAFIITAAIGEVISFAMMKYAVYVRDQKRAAGEVRS